MLKRILLSVMATIVFSMSFSTATFSRISPADIVASFPQTLTVNSIYLTGNMTIGMDGYITASSLYISGTLNATHFVIGTSTTGDIVAAELYGTRRVVAGMVVSEDDGVNTFQVSGNSVFHGTVSASALQVNGNSQMYGDVKLLFYDAPHAGLVGTKSIVIDTASPYETMTLTSEGTSGGWAGRINNNLSNSGDAPYTASTLVNVSGAPRMGIGIGNVVPNTALEVSGTVSANDFGTGLVTLYTGSSTANITGFASVTALDVKYQRVGKILTIWFSIAGVSNSTATSFIIPFTGSRTGNYSGLLSSDNGGANNTGGYIANNSNGVILLYKDGAASNWTASGNKAVYGSVTIPIN